MKHLLANEVKALIFYVRMKYADLFRLYQGCMSSLSHLYIFSTICDVILLTNDIQKTYTQVFKYAIWTLYRFLLLLSKHAALYKTIR